MAASRIKGITIEIGGDTTKLQTALKGVNTEIKNTQAQLKDVEKLLKLDPGNTELLAQKHKLLGQAVEETKNKLETLKTAQQQADEALKNGTISKDQYDALQREIIETEQELKRLEEQANQSATALQKISATGEKFQEVGGKIEGAGKKMLPVTATVTALGTASDAYEQYSALIKDNIEFEIMLERYPFDTELITGIYELILETVLCQSEQILIASNRYPTELVRSKFLKLNSGHVEYVIDGLKSNTSKVRNIKKYLLAALFNAPTTISGYYQALVNHDMPQFAKGM